MESTTNDIIHQGNTTISVETLPDYSHPVVIKKLSKHHSSLRNTRSLEKEYEITSFLAGIEGVGTLWEPLSLEDTQ